MFCVSVSETTLSIHILVMCLERQHVCQTMPWMPRPWTSMCEKCGGEAGHQEAQGLNFCEEVWGFAPCSCKINL